MFRFRIIHLLAFTSAAAILLTLDYYVYLYPIAREQQALAQIQRTVEGYPQDIEVIDPFRGFDYGRMRAPRVDAKRSAADCRWSLLACWRGPANRITELKVRGTAPCHAALENLHSFKMLRSASFTNCNLTDEQLRAFAAIEMLEVVEIDSPKVNGTFIQYLPRPERLVSIRLAALRPGAGVRGIRRATNLQRLAVGVPEPVSDDDWAQIGALRQLTLLELNGCITDQAMPHVAQLQNLDTLMLISHEVSDAGFAELGGHPGLCSLFFHGVPITDRSIPIIEGLPRLEHCNIVRSMITPEGAQHLQLANANFLAEP